MANITPLNVSSPNNFVKLFISTDKTSIGSWTATTTNVLTVPSLQDITVTNSNGTFRWVTLDSTSRAAVATPATNSLNFNIVLDDTTFFSGSGTTGGLQQLSNDKSRVYFQFNWGGGTTTAHITTGTGFLANLAPKVNPDQPVWMTPLVIEVDGNYTIVS